MRQVYCFDLDDTLCATTEGDYVEAVPLYHRINKVNKLHKAGNYIIIATARGSVTGLDWFIDTKNQLDRWGVKYDALQVGKKAAADFYVDDKGVTASDFFENVDNQMVLDLE